MVYCVLSEETISGSCGAPSLSIETDSHDDLPEKPLPQSSYAQSWREVPALKKEPRSSEHSVLVIRTGALGDTILTFPVLDSIRAAHPGETVVFLGNRAYRELIPEGIEFHPVDAPEWSWLFRYCEPGDCGEDLFTKRSSPHPSQKTSYALRNSASPLGKPSCEHIIKPSEQGTEGTPIHKSVSPVISRSESGFVSAGAPGRPRSFRKAYVILNRPDDVIRNLARTGVRE